MSDAVLSDAPQLQAPEQSVEEICFPDLPQGIDPDSNLGKAIAARQVKARLRATAMLTLKAQGYSYGQIADMLKISSNSVKQACKRARSAGKLNDLRDTLENESLALAIDSLNHHLKEKDKDMTKATLQGLGHFRNYSHSKNEGAPGFQMPALQVNVVVQQGQPAPTADTFAVSEGVMGVPRADTDIVVDG